MLVPLHLSCVHPSSAHAQREPPLCNLHVIASLASDLANERSANKSYIICFVVIVYRSVLGTYAAIFFSVVSVKSDGR